MLGIDYDEAFEICHWTLDVYSYAMFHFEPCLNVGISSMVCVRMVEATGNSIGWRTLLGKQQQFTLDKGGASGSCVAPKVEGVGARQN